MFTHIITMALTRTHIESLAPLQADLHRTTKRIKGWLWTYTFSEHLPNDAISPPNASAQLAQSGT